MVELRRHRRRRPFHSSHSAATRICLLVVATIAALVIATREDIHWNLQAHESSPLFTPPLGTLNCSRQGPNEFIRSEMIYWREISSDRNFRSPFGTINTTKHHHKNREESEPIRYLSVEVDKGGFNNIRMTVEIAMALAFATGRTFIVPPRQRMMLLDQSYTLHDYYNLDSLDTIEMCDFLENTVMTGHVRNKTGSRVIVPPKLILATDGAMESDAVDETYRILRSIGESPLFRPVDQVILVPESPHKSNRKPWQKLYRDINNEGNKFEDRIKEFRDNPTAVDAPAKSRFREYSRFGFWLYDAKLQKAPLIHFLADDTKMVRMHGHFYQAIFFADWRMDLLVKRYVRDRLRFRDELFCAAGQVVQELRRLSSNLGHVSGHFYTYHVRRNDFAWINLIDSCQDIVDNTKDLVPDHSVVYIATDERNKAWFQALKDRYHVYFLDDFLDKIDGLHSNFFGVVDYIVASKGKRFVGAYYSSATAHVNHLRGYYSQKEQSPGWELGLLESYHYAPLDQKGLYRHFEAPSLESVDRACPAAWRFIDKGIGYVGAAAASG